ncbi:MAG: hypothetical protein JKY94_00765 [Rhodobacteraceae bacterium]|nr:hypothetical protein [Paracoccaceae bacterium]
MITNEILTIFAIICGPLSAVLISIWLSREKERRDRKFDIFKTLMRTRRTPILQEHVGALNLIEIEYTKNKAVIKKWKKLFEHFGTTHARNLDEEVSDTDTQERKQSQDEKFYQRLSNERQALLAKLLHKMAQVLDFRIEQLKIFEGGYSPQGWTDVELQQAEIRRFVIDLGAGRRVIPVGVVGSIGT